MSRYSNAALCSALAACAACLPADTAAQQRSASRDVQLSFGSGNCAPVDDVLVWVTRDAGRTWQAVTVARLGPHLVRYTAPADGWHGFYIVLSNPAGLSAPPPAPGAAPHASVLIDTIAPTLQLHPADLPTRWPAGEKIRLRLSLFDENGPPAVRVFYRPGDERSWADGGPGEVHEGMLEWLPPADVTGSIAVLVSATDAAGNRSTDVLPALEIALPRAGARPAGVHANELAASPLGSATQPAAATQATVIQIPAEAPPVSPQPLAAEAPPEGERARRSEPVAEHDQKLDPDRAGAEGPAVTRLRELAARYVAEGRHDLAGTPLEEALQLAPANPHLLTELGSVLYWSHDYEGARTRFESALAADARHPGALEGLALLAATQHRYADASAHLERLLQITPGAAPMWLRYGDLQHRLGRTGRALEAWQRAAEVEDAGCYDIRARAQKRIATFGPSRADAPESP